MGLGDMAKKAKQALNSEKGEQVSDTVLDRGSDLANRATGGRYEDKVASGRDAVDDRVGRDGPGTASQDATAPDDDDAGRPSGRRRADSEVDARPDGDPPAGRHRT